MNNQNDQPNDVPSAAQRLNLAVAQVESAARFLSHPNFILQMREAMIEAAVVAGAEWLVVLSRVPAYQRAA